MSRLNAMMEQYKHNSTPSNKKESSNKTKYDENNYFGTRLEVGINTAQKKVRIIEPKGENETPFVETMGHKKKVDGKWKTFMCPKHEDGSKCPFCEARDILLAEGTPEAKKQAAEYSAKKMYIVKLIDRENPEHGVKFWRFNHHYKNAGTFDKIYAASSALPANEDPFSSASGRDMIISISRDGANSVVTGINFDYSQSPLEANSELATTWKKTADEKTWRDVFSVKPYDYLEIIVRGGSPIWKKNETGEGGKWIDKAELETKSSTEPTDDFSSELSIGNTKENVSMTQAPQSLVPDSNESDEDDDLPF